MFVVAKFGNVKTMRIRHFFSGALLMVTLSSCPKAGSFWSVRNITAMAWDESGRELLMAFWHGPGAPVRLLLWQGGDPVHDVAFLPADIEHVRGLDWRGTDVLVNYMRRGSIGLSDEVALFDMQSRQCRLLPIHGTAQWLSDGRIAVLAPPPADVSGMDRSLSLGTLESRFPTSDVVANATAALLSPNRRLALVATAKKGQPLAPWSRAIWDVASRTLLHTLPDDISEARWLDSETVGYRLETSRTRGLLYWPNDARTPNVIVDENSTSAIATDGESLAVTNKNHTGGPLFSKISVQESDSIVVFQSPTFQKRTIFDASRLPEGPPLYIP
jgi:hypothetical protein